MRANSIETCGRNEGDRRAELLPASLLPHVDDAFVRSCDLLEEFVHRLVFGIVQKSGLAEAAQRPGTPTELAARAGMAPERTAAVVPWLLEMMVQRGNALREQGGNGAARYSVPAERTPQPAGDIEALQRQHDSTALPAYALASRAAAGYPEFLAGGRRGEEILFAGDGLDLWLRYFSVENPLYGINNTVGALAVAEWISEARGEWLELGGGGGSGSVALLERVLRSQQLRELERYHFTEYMPMLLRRGVQVLRQRFGETIPLAFSRLDMDRDFEEQGVARSSLQLVYAVNTLHIARNLAFTLGQIRRVLEPGGWLVVAEGIRPRADQPLYTEFVFLLLEAYREPRLEDRRLPVSGFHTPEEWEDALRAAGFEDLRTLPDLRAVRDVYPGFVVGAIGARRPF